MSWVREGMAAAFGVAAAPASPLRRALLRHAHELDYRAERTRDGAVHDLLVDDCERVLRRISGLEAAATVAHFGVGGLNEPSGAL